MKMQEKAKVEEDKEKKVKKRLVEIKCQDLNTTQDNCMAQILPTTPKTLLCAYLSISFSPLATNLGFPFLAQHTIQISFSFMQQMQQQLSKSCNHFLFYQYKYSFLFLNFALYLLSLAMKSFSNHMNLKIACGLKGTFLIVNDSLALFACGLLVGFCFVFFRVCIFQYFDFPALLLLAVDFLLSYSIWGRDGCLISD